jgi:hypothetical protein
VVKHLKLRGNKPKRAGTPTDNTVGPVNPAEPPAQSAAETPKPGIVGASDDGRGPTEKAA